MGFKRVPILLSYTVFVIYVGLILSLVYFFDTKLFLATISSDRVLFSIRLSLFAATFATLLSVCIGVPSAYALSRYRFYGRTLVDTILELPMIVSPVALGAVLLIFFNTPLGDFIQTKMVHFVFSVSGILLAQFITTLGMCIRLIKAAMDEIPYRYEEAAKTLGASPARAFFTVTLPLSKNGIIAASILTWAKALGEFGATITIAGSMAMRTETLPIAIFMRLANADIEGTVVLVLILLSIGILTLYGVRISTKRSLTYAD